ncbi:hypothetical protein [Pelagicoccus mobilis]|uniref:DUF4405 domain-containing protein n=1 Tax=Pelagicoccus mobilis TaxID=415221 RepID=A0A934S0K0_9BACT|nr:hypothetical protein [Pelagicoccus mobilis]MBK1879703.1 hypothetical protein [Pelagicoccus mobilis]
MKHYVNISLLFAFAILIASAVLRFTEAFSIITTRVHIVFGLMILLLVGLHLSSRFNYLARAIVYPRRKADRAPTRAKLLALPVLSCGYLLFACFLNWWPVPQLISLGYEARHRAIIFRPEEGTAIRPIDNGIQLKRQGQNDISLSIEVEWGPAFDPSARFPAPFNNARPQIAIWAESSAGALIETFFVSEESAFTENLDWAGTEKRRVDILPVWRRQFTFVSGVDPDGKVDAYSGATPEHSFSVDNYIGDDPKGFYLSVEVNAPNDPNKYYHSNQAPENDGYSLPGVGQPSLYYSAFIDPEDPKDYYLMEYVGHGGTNNQDGDLNYDSKHITSAHDLIEKILVNVRRK